MAAATEVNITVFYESLCQDSIRFIKRQLYPTYKVLGEYMNVEFVPFGKAHITLKPWRIVCQHGRFECLGNAVQACALERKSDNNIQMEIVHCYMADSNPPSATYLCGKKFNFNGGDVLRCATGGEGRRLLSDYQERTQRFKERLSFVPTILFNDEFSSTDQNDALKNLFDVVCRKLEPQVPDKCKK